MVLGILISLLAALHMLAVGVASVLPLFIAATRWFSVGNQHAIDTTLHRLAKFAAATLVVAAVVGLMAGYLRFAGGDASYTAALARFPARVYLDAGIQWFFSLLCYGGWIASWNWGRRHPYAHSLLVLVAATNLLYHFPPLMFLQRMLADRPELVAEPLVTRALALKVILGGELLSRTLHFVAFASTLSCGVLLFMSPKDRSRDTNRYRAATAWGGVAASTAVILSGIAVVIFIPGSETAWLTGTSLLATLALLATIAISLAIVVLFGQIAFEPNNTHAEARPLQLAVLATFLMTFADRAVL